MSNRKRYFRDTRTLSPAERADGNPFIKRRRKNQSQQFQTVRQELNFQSLLETFNAQNSNNHQVSHFNNFTNDREVLQNCTELIEECDTIPVHQGLMDMYEKISPSPEDHSMRLMIINHVKKIIYQIWPSAVVEVFGSFCTGLYLPSGDIDMVVFGNWPQEMLRNKRAYYYLAHSLNRSQYVKKNSVQVIGFAKVPLVKFEDSTFNISFDISFNVFDGLSGVIYLKEQLKEYPCLRILIMLVKQILHERRLNTVYRGGLSSYSLYMMIISFLQRHPRVDLLRTNTPVNIAVILIEFFDLYGSKFNYDTVCISPKEGVYRTRDDFYKEYKLAYPNRASICIQDPCALQNDIGKGSFCMPEIKLSFLRAKSQLIELLKKHL